MIKGYHSEIMAIYDEIRNSETKALTQRREIIKKQLPEVLNIEKNIGKLCVELSLSSLRKIKNREEYLKELESKITELRIKKVELLVSNGYDRDFLNLHYRCSKCKDTGFIGATKCSCYKQKLVQTYYKNSQLEDMLKNNNFNNFDTNLYENKKTGNEPDTPRKNIEKILNKSFNFINNFQNTNENLFFYGNSGTGKTFLTYCIAKELLDKGYLVVYKTSENLIKNLRQIRFEENTILEDLIMNCDLLIIDDLGTEQINDFSKTELFNLLNQKILREKKMIVSTNYSLEELLKNYSERITSRLFGNFNLCKFYGDDIRVKINLKKMKENKSF